MKSEWAKVVKYQSLFWPGISKARRLAAGQVSIWTVAHSGERWFICRMAPVAWFCHMQIKWSVINWRLLFCREWSRLFLDDDDGRSGWSRGALSLKLVHFMPDVVRYVWYELLRTFLGALAFNIRLWLRSAPSILSQRLRFRLYILALHMHSYMPNISNKKASLTFKSRLAFCIGIHVTLFARVSPFKRQRKVSCVFQRLSETRFERKWCCAVFLPFSDGEIKTICQLEAWFKGTRVIQKSVPVGRVGPSVGCESCWSVGSLKLIKIIIFGRNSFVLRPHFS